MLALSAATHASDTLLIPTPTYNGGGWACTTPTTGGTCSYIGDGDPTRLQHVAPTESIPWTFHDIPPSELPPIKNFLPLRVMSGARTLLSVTRDGRVYVRGKLVAKDKELADVLSQYGKNLRGAIK